MAQTLTLPELGEGIAGGDVVNVLVRAGDIITENQPLLEMETDKAVVEVPATLAGRVEKVHVSVGQHIKVGQPLLDVAAAEQSAPAMPAPEAPPDAELQVNLPELGEGIAAGDVVNILVKVGDLVLAEQGLIEVETDKAVAEVPSPRAGQIRKILVKTGEKVKVGTPVAVIAITDGALVQAAPPPVSVVAPKPTAPLPTPTPPRSALPPPAPSRPVAASPSVRRFARELGVDITAVTGAGPGGRVGIEDIKAYVRDGQAGARTIGVGGAPLPPALPDFSQWGPVERKPLSSLRKKIADQMQLAWTVPTVTHFDEADVTELEAFRKAQSPAVKQSGGSLTITCFLFKAVAEALHEFPNFNTTLDLARGELIYKRYVHLGIAVDTEAGLVVPVIRDVDRKSLRELAKELTDISHRARARKLGVEEMRGATFSISNLGGIGGTQFTPLVNPPQVAILGVSKGRWQPQWREGQFVPRLMCPLALSYDHRVIDGADAARFSSRIVRALENFATPLLDTKPSV